ncbi:F-box protein At3g56470-like [Silene latifolia]|uniref:F-box protein At3g56470-like n=1 Tax=Silene latifolia TaxID=37657 RepID=UPI003D778097
MVVPVLYHSRKRCLVCIKVADDGSNSFTIKSLPLISMPQNPLMLMLCSTFMVESCGSIYVVKVGTRHYDGVHRLQIFELDLQKGSWVEVKCLGDRAFLLVEDGCTWWPASTGTVKGNCVYFFRSQYVQEAVVCYSLNDCSSTFLPCPKLLNPRSYWPVWVTPQHNRISARLQSEKSCEVEAEAVSTTECKSVFQVEEKKQENNLYKLPLHIIELTSKYMHLFDYWSFRCTSKIIQSATPMPQWKKNNVFPLLMVFEDESGLCQIMDPCREDSSFCNFEAQDFFDIKFSKNGWLLIYDGKSIQFLNPFTREKRYLPHPPTRHFLTIGFSSYPSCSSCLTVAINFSDGVIINYLQFEDKEWNSCHFGNNQDGRFCPGFASPMYYAGGFYFLDEDTGNLGVFQLGDGDPRWTVYGRPFVRAGGFHSSYLVECGGDLISVFIGKKGCWVQVFRFNFLNKKWFRAKDLGNHILFISHNSCFSEEVSKVNRMRNRIYLPWLKGNNIVYYSLETQKYHVDGSEDEYKDFFFMKQPYRCCWI